jgi:uncharacterized protein YjbI with pentapeptide repeats
MARFTVVLGFCLAVTASGYSPRPVSRVTRTAAVDKASSSSATTSTSSGSPAAAMLAAVTLAASVSAVGGGFAGPAFAAEKIDIAATSASGITYRLPPIKETPNRCTFVSSAMGQANGARDSLQDFRGCDMSGKSAPSFDLSGAVGSDATFAKVNFKEAQLSKCFFRNSKFDEADFTNGIVDRVDFEGASLRGSIFNNAVLSTTSFKDADLTDADFSEAYLGDFDLKKLCKNPTLKGENPKTGMDTRASAGCGGS